MPIVSCRDLSLSFGNTKILDHATFDIQPGERLCLTGRNGTGKSTLLKILTGQQHPDEGAVHLDEGLKVSALQQSLPVRAEQRVFDAVAEGFGETGLLLGEYHRLLDNPTAASGNELDLVQQKIEHADAWNLDYQIQSVLDRLQLESNKLLTELSGGWLRRVAIARSLVTSPDLWILDEPTNHLDITAIDWLEDCLANFAGTIIFVSHDRRLMQNLGTSVLDLDLGQIQRFDCDYQTYLERKEQQGVINERHEKLFDKRLGKEEAWIREGIKARRTRNEGRVRALLDMRAERQQRRTHMNLKLEMDEGKRSGNIVKELTDVNKGYGDQKLITDLNLTLRRGDRLGILGPNGCGKSTLLRLLLEQEQPDSGNIKTGTKLEVAYFDQVRQQLDPERSLKDVISEGREFITINDKSIHVVSWLGNFMFTPDHARSPVRVLSGGEQNRLLLAKLFSLPANLLVLDEPTNDLDVQSLELLEELLLEYKGTVLLVTHDRTFLDNVVTSMLVFEGKGVVREFVGGYSEWSAAGGNFSDLLETRDGDKPKQSATSAKTGNKTEPKVNQARVSRDQQKEAKKLERELEKITREIEKTESRIALLHEAIASSEFYKQSREEQQTTLNQNSSLEKQLATLYERWEKLESG